MTQDEMKQLINAMRRVFPAKEEVVTREEFSDEMKHVYKMLEYLPSRNHFDQRMDEMMKDIQIIRDEQIVLSNQVANHSDRLKSIESILHIQNS